MALTAAFSMTLGTAPAEQPGYAGHFILKIGSLVSEKFNFQVGFFSMFRAQNSVKEAYFFFFSVIM